MRTYKALALAVVVLGLVLGGCGKKKGPVLAADGLPVWIDQACDGQPDGSICAVGESDFVKADVEAGKSDAETAAKNRIADQINTRVGRLTERLVSAMKDLSKGKILGEKTIKDINQNYIDQEIVGLRYVDYFYHPSRVKPKKVWVRAVVTVDSVKMSEDIASSILGAAAAEKLEIKHEEAQARFDKVRREYLAEEKAGGKAEEAATGGTQ